MLELSSGKPPLEGGPDFGIGGFLDALNTGHRGSLSTIHANSAEDALRRLAHLAMRGSGNVSLRDVEEECGRSIDLIAHVARVDGWRRVTEIYRASQRKRPTQNGENNDGKRCSS